MLAIQFIVIRDNNIVAAFQGMHVSPAKHSYAWLPRKCDYRTDRQTDGQTHGQTDVGQSYPYVSLCFTDDTKSGITDVLHLQVYHHTHATCPYLWLRWIYRSPHPSRRVSCCPSAVGCCHSLSTPPPSRCRRFRSVRSSPARYCRSESHHSALPKSCSSLSKDCYPSWNHNM